MRYLSLAEILVLHERVVGQTGGATGLRDLAALQSAIAQPHATFDGADLYASLPEKGAALAVSLVSNHPFVDGNKRVGHAALETFLILNGFELNASVDESERTFLALAAGTLARSALTDWIAGHLAPFPGRDRGPAI
jgi:death-on-curing protein